MKYYLSELEFESIAKWIDVNSDEILNLLSDFSTVSSIKEEIKASVKALYGASSELEKYKPIQTQKMAIFHPSNALLYSYILYGIIPSSYVKEIFIRPSSITSTYMEKIHEFFKKKFDLHIRLEITSQKKFREKTSDSDLVVFTGQYENSLEISNYYPSSIFIFFGSGSNPIIFSSNYDPIKAVSTTLNCRLLNSGQDCFMSDIFFINNHIFDPYYEWLLKVISKLKFGKSSDSDYGPIVYPTVFSQVHKFIKENSNNLAYKGEICVDKKIISPHVFVYSIEEFVQPIEFFSPIFNIVRYNDINKVKDWLLSKEQLEKAMAVSVYGNDITKKELKNKYNFFKEKTVLEAENGNEPFGGYGIKSNYVKRGNVIYSRPILISEVISRGSGENTDRKCGLEVETV